MLKASTMGQDGRPIFIFGFGEEDFKQLMEVGISCHSLEEMGGLAVGTVVLAAGMTSEELLSRLEKLGFALPDVGLDAN